MSTSRDMSPALSAPRTALPALSDRATAIVDYLIRYSILIPPILHRMHPELSPEALRKFMERMAQDQWITKHPLPRGEGCYWALTSRACNRLELKRKSSPLRQGPLIRHCLQNLFFAASPHLRLLTSAECREALPLIYRRGSSNQYFLDTQDAEHIQLGWLLIDDGKKPLRVWSKAKEVASSRKANAPLYELCVSGGFRLTVVTTTSAKAEKIRKLFDDRPFRDIPVDVFPVADSFPTLLLPGKGA